MTVGQVARRMGVTVRTLQYYDREGLLSPSATSEGGRRLYTDKDLVTLHQILSLKHLGFSLDDIKNRLIPLDTPADIAEILSEQAAAVRDKIDRLSESLKELDALRAEVLQMRTVDFKKYADIIVNLRMKNDYYWLIKYFDDQALDNIRGRFDIDSGAAFMRKFLRLQAEAVQLQKEGVSPGDEKGQTFAKAYWDMITEFTGGDMTLLSKLIDLGQLEGADERWGDELALATAFLEPALDVYLTNLGVDPFQEKA